jgi:RNA polymerase sigma factor (sigma-70 family)
MQPYMHKKRYIKELLARYKETRDMIHKALGQLAPQKRLIYQMSRNEGLKTAEIAKKLQLSHSHVRNSLSSVGTGLASSHL